MEEFTSIQTGYAQWEGKSGKNTMSWISTSRSENSFLCYQKRSFITKRKTRSEGQSMEEARMVLIEEYCYLTIEAVSEEVGV
jgi:hypothetical protein